MPEDEQTDLDILQSARALIIRAGILTRTEAGSLVRSDRCRRIASDGSTRRFWRVTKKDTPICIIAAPAGRDSVALAESRSAWKIGRHLHQKGIPVPEMYGWDSSTGLLLFEDLGDRRLHDLVVTEESVAKDTSETVVAGYHQALKHLAAMQCYGAEGFDQAWCWDSPQYDQRLMLEKESGYFLRAFWRDYLGKKVVDGVDEELKEIAGRAGQAPANFFLHRDFQSRNIMVQDGAIRFIDFQGGRLGPLGYDLASLLIDPYCRLSHLFQEQLLEVYLQELSGYQVVDEAVFRRQYTLLAFQRNMQIIGAFSYLYRVRKKTFFLDFIRPSLKALSERLEEPDLQEYPLIRTMVIKGLKEMVRA